MKKTRETIYAVLSILLAFAIVLNNGAIMKAFAVETEESGGNNGGGSGSGDDGGNGGSGDDGGNGGSGDDGGGNGGSGDDGGGNGGSGDDGGGNGGSGDDGGGNGGSGDDGGNGGSGDDGGGNGGSGDDGGNGGSGDDGGNGGSGEGGGNGSSEEGGNGGSGEEGGNGGSGEGGGNGTGGEGGDGENGGDGSDEEQEKDPAEDGEHIHTWMREKGEIYAVCTECGEEYRDDDCDPDGIGVHIFELIRRAEEDVEKEIGEQAEETSETEEETSEEEAADGTGEIWRCAVCGFEKETLDEWDLTLEEYMEIAGIGLYSYEYNGETSSLPTTLAELNAALDQGYYENHVFNIKNFADLLAMQELSKAFSFEDYRVQFVGREDPNSQGTLTTWDLRPLADRFDGLGTADYPFKGMLTTFYANNSLRFMTKSPMLNYAAAGATVSEFQITSEINGSGDPVGVIAAHVVDAPDQEKVNLSNLIISGDVKNAKGPAGILFGEAAAESDTLKLQYSPEDHITLSASVNAQNAGGIVGKASGKTEIYDSNPSTSGTVSGSESAGMLAGTVEDTATLYLDGDNEIVAKVEGAGRNGGLVGWMKDGKIERSGEGTLTVSGTVRGTDGSTVALGGVVGQCEDTGTQLTHLKISASLTGNNASTTSIGGVLGQFITQEKEGAADDPYDLIDQVEVTGALQTGKNIGGVVGGISGHNLRIGDPESGSVSVTGGVNGNNSPQSDAVGGVAGMASGQYIEVCHARVGGNSLIRSNAVGGIFGRVNGGTDGSPGTVVKVQDVEISGTSTQQPSEADYAQGGIFGAVAEGCLAALDGNIQVDFNPVFNKRENNYQRTGYIAGGQTEALIYFEKEAQYQRTERNFKDDIGNYGGVYRNRDGALISYTQKGVTGSVGSSGSDWLLASEEDVMRLAIALNTEGRFASNCFGGAAKRDLLGAGYQLKADKTYELTDSGIYDLNRNDRIGESNNWQEIFHGQFHGNGAVLRLGSYDTYQRNVALFPCVGDDAVLENFTLEGKDGAPRTIRYAKEGAAGLAVYGRDDVTVENVTVRTSIEGTGTDFPENNVNSSYGYGGMFAGFNAGAGTTLKVENSRLEGSLTVTYSPGNDSKQQYAGGMIASYTSSAKAVIRINGLNLCQKIDSTSRYTSGMITRINDQNTNTDRTVLEMSDITVMDGSSLYIHDDKSVSGTYENAAGGFLGREWFDVAPGDGNFSIRNLTVGTGDASSAPYLKIENMGTFGGMIHTVTGRMQWVDTRINDVRIVGNNTANDGLLVNNGYDALIEIDGYTMPSPEKVSISGVSNFSEIVGRNIGSGARDNAWNGYVSGGIVNIISSDFKGGSQVYQNRVAGTAESGKVRYYYNLFGESLAGESSFLGTEKLDGSAIVIQNADQMLIWHLNQYMNETIRKRYLAPYFTGGVPDRNGNVTLRGNIDLSNESYYPTPLAGNVTINGGGAQVKFDAGTIEAKAGPDTGRKPSATGEHYMMHSGLFLSKTGNVTVQGSGTDAPEEGDYFTITGTVANVKENSGALFNGEIAENKNVYRVKLKDLYIDGYTGDHVHGLIISKVNDNSTINLSWLKTEYSGTGQKAASALIGRVGDPAGASGKGSSNINIEFSNMDVDAAVTGIFKNATFIDQHYYTDDTAINQGRVRYLFTEEAAKGTDGAAYDPFQNGTLGHNNYQAVRKYITLGSELQYGIEYWNVSGNKEAELKPVGGWGTVLPYVCEHPESKEIEVNPKTKDIIEGCGVYEDPYVLNDAKQVLALSRYLTNPNDRKYLLGWKINRIGNNSTFCGGSHTDADLVEYTDPRSADFPTPDQLRQAYYVITADIDLSRLSSITDSNIAQEFVGLGTKTYPFAGVIVGKKEDGSIPTVTLPKKKRSSYAANFGLIQYAKGAVVKDLKITSDRSQDSRDADLTDSIRVRENAGAVFACVLGGDNIIDSVTVSSRISPVGSGLAAGGYVGTLQQGSVILRNMSEGGVSGFGCFTVESTGVGQTPASVDPKDYPYVSGLIGKVENGFALYEGSAGGPVLGHGEKTVSGVYQHGVLPISQTYDIIVAEHTDMQAAENSPMNIDPVSGGFSCQIGTAAQLQIVSMAINSDAFSVCYDDNKASNDEDKKINYGGYDKKTACRKAAYDKVGACTAGDSDYQAATKKDDGVYWYPYIYKYFLFDSMSASSSDRGAADGFYKTLETYTNKDGEEGYRSRLNAVVSAVTDKMSYQLVDGANEVDYDLSVYKRGFRGLGATYRVFKEGDDTAENSYRDIHFSDSVYSDFRASFDGKGATVKAEMINDYEKSIHTTALFNDLINVDAHNTYEITNLVVTGRFENTVENTVAHYCTDRTSAVVGMMRRPWKLENITVKDVTVKGPGFTAGVAAWISPGDEKDGEVDYRFTKCKLTGSSVSPATITTVGGSCGGIVGMMSPLNVRTVPDNVIQGRSLTLTDCQVAGQPGTTEKTVKIVNEGMGLLGINNGDQCRYGRGRSGGLVGFVGKRTVRPQINPNNGDTDDGIKVIIDTTIVDGEVVDAQIEGTDSTGGILGEYFGYSVDNSMTLTGGNRNIVTLTVESATVQDSSVSSKNRNENRWASFGVGGIVGKVGRATGCRISDSYVLQSDVKANQNANNTTTVLQAGGVIGTCYYGSRTTLSNVTVKGAVDAAGALQNEISSVTADAGGLIGRTAQVYTGDRDNQRANTSIDIVGCQVSNMRILSDNRSTDDKAADKASGTSGGAVGGMAGRIYTATISVTKGGGGESKVENCVIRTGTGNSSTRMNPNYNAGGVIGLLYYQSEYTVEDTDITDSNIGYNGRLNALDVHNGAGGIIGRICGSNVGGAYYTTGRLKRVKVTSCDIFGSAAGGLVGYATNCNQLGNVWNSDGDDIRVSDNQLMGRYTGGAIGYQGDNVLKNAFEHVTIQNNHILALWNNDSYAGGFCGYAILNGNSNFYHQIEMKENQIMSCNTANSAGQSAGGMYGHIYGAGLQELHAYETKVQDNHIGYYPFAGNNADVCIGSIDDQMQTIRTRLDGMGTTETARLLNKQNQQVSTLSGIKTQEDILTFAGHFGNLVGTYNGGRMHANFVKPEITYTVAYGEGTVRPVTDVGYQTAGAAGNKLFSGPYDYRKNIHVIYFEPENNEAALRWQGLTSGSADNLFTQIPMKKILDQYQEANTAATSTPVKILEAYRLNLENDAQENNLVTDTYSQVYFGEDDSTPPKEDYRSPIMAGGVTLPMIVLDAQYGTADQLMSNVFAMLTNSGGVLNSGDRDKNADYDDGLFDLTSVTLEAMKVENDVLSKGDAQDISLVCETTGGANGNNGRREFAYTRKFDTASDTGGTFTMVTVTYGKSSYAGIDTGTLHCTPQVTVKIPVFVMERLTIDTYMKLVEGMAYNVDKAKENGIDHDPLLASDSSYTMYVEYIYGEARKRFSTDDLPIAVEKTVSMTKTIDDQDTNVPFAKGTVFTLIDVCNSDKVYYYEVTGEETGPVKYSDFKDAAGNPYQNKPIHDDSVMEVYGENEQFVSKEWDTSDPNPKNHHYEEQVYQDVAVERFLIVVDTSRAEQIADDRGEISTYHVTPELPDNIEKRSTLTQHTDMKVTIQKGITIGFVRKEDDQDVTVISGGINADDGLAVEGQFRISAKEEYWDRVLHSPDAVIDSANHGKYLDLGLYLTATKDNETVRVPLPDNTNVSIYLERLHPLGQVIQDDVNLGSYVNEAAVYVYKDGRLEFPLDELKDLIQREIDDSERTRGEVTVAFKINLDFELADLTDYVDETYGVYLDLLRVEEVEYPAGGEMIDEIQETCPGAKQSDIACALETKDLMQLGINTYDNQSKSEECIDFRFDLDFNGVWTKNDEANQKIADKYYKVTYRILEKTNRNGKPDYYTDGKPNYYTGDHLELQLVAPKSGEELKKGAGSTGEEENSRYVLYQFDFKEIEDGTKIKDEEGNSRQIERVVSRNLKLTVKDASDMDLTNYKIQASVMVYNPPLDEEERKKLEDIDKEVNRVLNDFFVFTIGRLKTDLDY